MISSKTFPSDFVRWHHTVGVSGPDEAYILIREPGMLGATEAGYHYMFGTTRTRESAERVKRAIQRHRPGTSVVIGSHKQVVRGRDDRSRAPKSGWKRYYTIATRPQIKRKRAT